MPLDNAAKFIGFADSTGRLHGRHGMIAVKVSTLQMIPILKTYLRSPKGRPIPDPQGLPAIFWIDMRCWIGRPIGGNIKYAFFLV